MPRECSLKEFLSKSMKIISVLSRKNLSKSIKIINVLFRHGNIPLAWCQTRPQGLFGWRHFLRKLCDIGFKSSLLLSTLNTLFDTRILNTNSPEKPFLVFYLNSYVFDILDAWAFGIPHGDSIWRFPNSPRQEFSKFLKKSSLGWGCENLNSQHHSLQTLMMTWR